MRNAYEILVGELHGNKSVSRSRRGWEDNIKTGLRGMKCEGVDWNKMAPVRRL
jgi:hypothetical protein